VRSPFRRDRLGRAVVGLLVLPGAGALLALAVCRGGAAALLWTASVSAAAAAFLYWNLKPLPPRSAIPTIPPPDPERLMHPDAAPLALHKGHRDLLFCVHGFPATPADFRPFLAEADVLGYDLAAPLLPGCGTRPGDLAGRDYDSFLHNVRSEYLRLRPRYERVFLVGQSLGGTLALALAEEYCAVPALAPAALAAIGAPVVLNSLVRHGMVRHPLIYLARFLGLFTAFLGARIPEPGREGEDGDERWLGYEGTYPRIVHSFQIRLPEVERKLRRVSCPVLICHARGDRMTDYRNAAIIASGVGSDRIETYTANMDRFRHIRHSLLLYDSQRDRVRERILRFFGEFRG
jgi:carboxylesterase